jgi:hypothetical protein
VGYQFEKGKILLRLCRFLVIINPLQAELAGSMRVALGLPMDGVEGGGSLDALAADADEV